MDNYENIKSASFFDLNENSMMDILIMKSVPLNTGSQSTSLVTAIYNNLGKDAFFLKTRVVSDASIGTSVSSASFRCVLTSLEDEKFMVQGS